MTDTTLDDVKSRLMTIIRFAANPTCLVRLHKSVVQSNAGEALAQLHEEGYLDEVRTYTDHWIVKLSRREPDAEYISASDLEANTASGQAPPLDETVSDLWRRVERLEATVKKFTANSQRFPWE